MKSTILPIFFAADDAYAPALGVAIESLLANASRDYRIRIHILTCGLSQENADALLATVGGRAELQLVDMKKRIAPLAERLVLRDYYSGATYFRLFISDLFPEYDKALYLDCDIVIHGDVCRLFETPLGDTLVGAAPEDVMTRFDVFGRYVETCLDVPREEYFNAGVLVMNLAAIRRAQILGRFVDLLLRRRFVVTQDEDYLNVLCRGAVTLLPYTWNTSPLATEVKERPALVHYKLDRKPWHYRDVHLGDGFWQYAEATPFYRALLAERDGYGEAGAARDREAFLRLCRLAEEEMEAEPLRRAADRREADCIA